MNGISGNHSSTSLSSQPSSYLSNQSQNSISSHDEMGNNGVHGIRPKTKVTNGVTVVQEKSVREGSEGIIEPELCKITPNSIYLTFNAPNVDEYVRFSQSLPDLD
jgi:hypothetical protein